MWCSKYGPKSFSELDFHQDKGTSLKQLVSVGDFPHLLFHGPIGSGRRTLITCLLNEIYGSCIERTKVEEMEFSTASKKIQINAISSPCHMMLTPSDVGMQDRVVVQEVIKKIAQTNQVTSSAGKRFKVIVLDDVDNLTKDAQQALRRTMEKYSNICRLILVCNSISKVIEALRSRTLPIRVPSPSNNDIEKMLQRIAKFEELTIPRKLLDRILCEADGNVQRAILLLETCRIQNYPFTDYQEVTTLEWKPIVKNIANLLVQEQTPARLINVRDQFYNLLGHLIPSAIIFEDLLDALLPLCDEKLKLKVIDLAATCQHRCALGTKSIFHLEAFAAGFMCIYKSFIFDNLDGFC
ncbi:hypothetical protein GJ496_008488 [Pomphorhynchus laevis]|nr:hypothetical protein GJ496_008488 [Pomphorhynchus laevis]